MKKIFFGIVVLVGLLLANAYALDKNTASQKWVIFCFDESDNTAKLDDESNITAQISIDGGAPVDLDYNGDTTPDNPDELGGGYYVFGINATQSNGNLITMLPDSDTANIQCIGCPASVWTTYSRTVEDSYDEIEALRLILRALVAPAEYTSGTKTWVVRDLGDSKDSMTIIYGTDNGDRDSLTVDDATE